MRSIDYFENEICKTMNVIFFFYKIENSKIDSKFLPNGAIFLATSYLYSMVHPTAVKHIDIK